MAGRGELQALNGPIRHNWGHHTIYSKLPLPPFRPRSDGESGARSLQPLDQEASGRRACCGAPSAAELHGRSVLTPTGKAHWPPVQGRRLLARAEVASRASENAQAPYHAPTSFCIQIAFVYRQDGESNANSFTRASECSVILVVGNTKGGVGKTTLAINLAIARALEGRDVLLVDGDEQGTATSFTELRTEQLGQAGYTAVSLHGAAIRTQTRQLAPKYSDVIIDVGGRDTGSLRAALTVADTLLIPVQPRSFDLWAVESIASLVKEAREINDRLRAVLVLNAADSQGSDNDAAAENLIEVEGLEYLPMPIGRRKAFPNAASMGRSVIEQTPRDPKAVQELAALVAAVFV